MDPLTSFAEHNGVHAVIGSVSSFLSWATQHRLIPSQALFLWFSYHPQSLAGFKVFNRVGGDELFRFLTTPAGLVWLRGETQGVNHLEDFFKYLLSAK